MKKPLNWVPLWIDSWLFGSTRIELTLEQRAIWIDLLAFAGKDQGFIRANEGIPYPIEQLAGLLRVPVELLKLTIDRCLETGKLTKMPDETLYITNWKRYKLTPQYRRRLKEEESPKEEERIEEKRVEESKGKGNTVSQKGNTLPPIPKGLDFKVQDNLKNMRAIIRQLEREYEDKDYLRRAGINEEEMLTKITKLQKEYCTAIEDYSD